ncbi:DUF2237 family protein [Salinisphaera aquimarina]|uniref:DUF2237 family protein n=1 Tax=Salinisphaera aquimarina TaxID=2094031 RepID=A0ABV7EPQ6_9GAMM
MSTPARNVLGEPLALCCSAPVTGFYRDGYCRTDDRDPGVHAICAVVTDAFLAFSAERGNDLSTPRPEFDFPGVRAGDRWCLCAARWAEALAAGAAPRVALTATHEAALEIVDMADLKAHAIDLS